MSADLNISSGNVDTYAGEELRLESKYRQLKSAKES